MAKWSNQLTAPSRRSEELARGERDLSLAEPVASGDEGHRTTVMETLSLVEAERQIAKEAMDGVQSGVREIAAAPVVTAPPVHAIPVAPQVTPQPEPPSEILVRAQRRRRGALWVVGAVMAVGLVLIALGLARGGWSLPGKGKMATSQSQR